ncbi:MAG: radical SAM protein [Cyanobacteria bacterium REEB65]|nr:radical SAM protein [Cyanobacteria bacterium REEB65]
MKVLLLNPPEVPGFLSDRDKAGGLGTMFPMRRPHGAVVPPMDLMYSAAACRQVGAQTLLLDAPALQADRQEVLRQAQTQQPDWIGVRLSLPSLAEDLAMAQQLIGAGHRVAVFGNVILTTADRWRAKLAAVVLHGEPEILWPELLAGDAPPGIWLPGDPVPPWQFAANLDALPIPAWDLAPLRAYSPRGDIGEVVFYLLTSRGCPRACSMCPYYVHQGTQWRARSVGSVMAELHYLRSLGARRVQVRDPNFGLDRRRLKELARALAGANLGLQLAAETDLEVLDEEALCLLAQAGIRTLLTGIESADPDCLADIRQSETAFRKNLQNIERCSQLGIEVIGFLVIGAASESHATVRRTVNIARRLPIRYSVSLMTPYPGTAFTQEALAVGRAVPSEDYHKMGGTRSLLRTRFMTRREVSRAHRWADCALRLAHCRRTWKLGKLGTLAKRQLVFSAADLAFRIDERMAARRRP